MADRSNPPADYFDRLLARHLGTWPDAPDGADARGRAEEPGSADTPGGSGESGAPGERVRRVRPRLPGPFERFQALRGEPVDPTAADPALLPAVRVPFGGFAADLGAPPRVRDQRRAALHGEPPADAALRRWAMPRPPAAPPHRPSAPGVTAADRDGTDGPARPHIDTRTGPGAGDPGGDGATRRRHPSARPEDAARLLPVERSPRHGTLNPPPPTAMPTPRPSDTATARGSAAQARGGRGNARRPPEPAVHVQIGRLEVRAAGAAGRGPAGTGPDGRGRAGRRAPTLSLADYLGNERGPDG